ncbi:hypothetical protein ACH4F6_31655 [Streptomyces sp. NPDC017936]|uniref:hypothetical protein n=1 Tax=Streptomyces sp. NPDC017936 TaxID=3365016 RepID=UPI0037985662
MTADQLYRALGQRLRTALDRKPAYPIGAPVSDIPTPRDLHKPQAPANGLVAHGEPVDIGWTNGILDARLHLTVRPDMDPLERDQLLADLRDALAPVVPVRPTAEKKP